MFVWQTAAAVCALKQEVPLKNDHLLTIYPSQCYRLSKGKCKNQFRKKTILKYVWNKVHSDESISNVDPDVVGCLCKSTDVTICVWVGVYDSLIIYDQDFTQAILILHLYLENLYKKYFLNTFQTYMYQMEGNPHPSHFFFLQIDRFSFLHKMPLLKVISSVNRPRFLSCK